MTKYALEENSGAGTGTK